MEIKAYAKINFILNVLGTRPDGYHEVETLMQAISLCDLVTASKSDGGITPKDFLFGEKDLAWRAAVIMAENFMPNALGKGAIDGISIKVEKHIPEAAGLAGGSADAAAVMVGLGKLWGIAKSADCNTCKAKADSADGLDLADADAAKAENRRLLEILLPLGAKLGSDVPFCIASQLGYPAAIGTGTGTELEFVSPQDCAVTLFFSEESIPDKTKAVYAELKDEDCTPRFDVRAFIKAESIEEKQALLGNHLQAPSERVMARLKSAKAPDVLSNAGQDLCKAQSMGFGEGERLTLCGAGPTYFKIGKEGPYHTITE